MTAQEQTNGSSCTARVHTVGYSFRTHGHHSSSSTAIATVAAHAHPDVREDFCLNEMANLISEEKKERNLSRVREIIKGNAFHEANAALPSASKKSLEKQQALLEKVLAAPSLNFLMWFKFFLYHAPTKPPCQETTPPCLQ